MQVHNLHKWDLGIICILLHNYASMNLMLATLLVFCLLLCVSIVHTHSNPPADSWDARVLQLPRSQFQDDMCVSVLCSLLSQLSALQCPLRPHVCCVVHPFSWLPSLPCFNI